MPDQTPVTDDDREAHVWANEVSDDPGWGRIHAVVRAIRAHVPAPPATLADELRKFAYKTIGADGYPLDDGDKELLDIADRAEAVEKANRDTERELLRAWAERDAAYSENNRVCAALATVTDERNNAWDRLADLQDVREELHAARAEVELLAAQIDRMVETYASEVERLTRERDEARGGRDAINKALSAAATRTAEALCERDEARAEVEQMSRQVADQMTAIHTANAEVERLTRESAARLDHIEVLEKRVERMVATGSTYPSDALPDPADVPEREVWEVTRVGRRAIGFRRDTGPDYHTWALVYEDGVIGRADDAVITLVSRLVRESGIEMDGDLL